MEFKNTLHIYAQPYWHEHAFIVGDRIALEALKVAIEHALANGGGTLTAFTADGEGYSTNVYCEEREAFWKASALPYTDEATCGTPHGKGGWDLWKEFHKREGGK